MPSWKSTKLYRIWWLPILVMLAGCGLEEPSFGTLSTTATLDRHWAARNEAVVVSLTGANSHDARVLVAGLEAEVTVRNANKFDFVVPAGTPAGKQRVEIHLRSQSLLTDLNVLGDDVVAGEFVLVVEPGTTEEELAEIVHPLSFEVLEGPYQLGAADGPCSADYFRIRIHDTDTGKALDHLKGKESQGQVWYSDPQSGYSSDTIDHLGAVGARDAHMRMLTGSGTVIAVLDTGVSEHPELGSRLLTAEGYDFVDEGTSPTDSFGDVGHGTPIAVLAAGSVSGVAPQSQVLPIRVCDDNGRCYSSHVTLGLCYALATAENELAGIENLVLNLSFGGDTPMAAVRAILDYAVSQGALVAAAGGNGRQHGSPRHFPAAYDLDGVVAVAALQAEPIDELTYDWKPAYFSTSGEYLDIAAPGAGLTSGTPSGDYHSGYEGTSFATALTSGALALWREANPSMAPAEVEAGLRSAARALPYPTTDVGAGMLDLSSYPR